MSENFERSAARLRPVFARIAEGAPQRERERILPFEQAQWLKDAGFGATRHARDEGGDGLTLAELFRLYIELAEADSNLAHAWRGHFEFIEGLRRHPDADVREFWRSRIVDHHEFIGNAWSERNDRRDFDTSVTRREDGVLILNGEKHYSTGTIFADWVDVLANHDEAPRSVLVRTDAPGVERIDDWNGFGQGLTGTGTTRFSDVVVDERHIDKVDLPGKIISAEIQVFQIVLLSVIVGITRRALQEVKQYILARNKPVFGGDATRAPKYDELIRTDLGRVAAAIYVAEAAVIRAAGALDLADANPTDADAIDQAVLQTSLAQVGIIPSLLDANSRIFDTVGASATSKERGLDRHWRNARIIASHNSLRYREKAIGTFELFGAFAIDEESVTDQPQPAATAAL